MKRKDQSASLARRQTELRLLEEIRQRAREQHTDTLSAAIAILADFHERLLALEQRRAA